MTVGVSLRPQVAVAPTPVQQACVNNCKEEMKQVKTAVQNNQITDIAAMTQKMQIESTLNDAKTAPVTYVEKTKPIEVPSDTTKVAEAGSLAKPENITDVIKNFRKGGEQYSNHERSQMLMDQMNQFAMNNRILHGLL